MVRVVARLLLILASLFAVEAALAAKRVALVIGIAKYTYAGTLANPVNDASDMAAALKGAEFTVIAGYDLDKPALERKIREFASALSGADTGVFFYAGHGLQVAGTNYIVPVDAELSTVDALEFEMIKLDAVQRIMENAAKTNILFLDACRNNPLARNLARALGTRGDTIGRGLAPAESGIGTLISFSTQPGNVASDGAGRNSPYTGPLVKRVATPAEDILSVLTAVRNDVLAATGNKQVPWENHALTARFYFNPTAPQAASAPPPAAGASQAPMSEAARAWSEIKDSQDAAVFEAFRKQYGGANALYDTLAARRIAALSGDKRTGQGGQGASWWPWSSSGSLQPAPEPSPQPQTALNVPNAVNAPNPPPAPPRADACDGLLVSVAMGKSPCIKPGSGEVFKDCPECPEMVVVPSGSFIMGSPPDEPERNSSEGPQHKVRIAKPFAVGRFAVTRDEFEEFAKDNGYKTEGGCHIWTGGEWKQDAGRSWRSPGFVQTGSHPVVCVNWNDAKAYVAWLSQKTGKDYRLLSEAEREYAARAGTTTQYWWGVSIAPEQANYGGSALVHEGQRTTLPVKSFKPNAWGLYQVHGNIWERTEDCWHDKYQNGISDGSADTAGECEIRVLRGGSWYDIPKWLRAAARSDNFYSPDFRYPSVGLRVARTVIP